MIAIGTKFKTIHSGICKVTKYENCSNVHVRFVKTGTTRVVQATHLRRGKVKDPIYPRIYGKGFLGEEGKSKKYKGLYYIWRGILQRSYSKRFQDKYPTYKDCRVVKRWHSYQNFCKDISKLPNWNTPGFDLDKDLRVFGNKIYGPRYCSFIPHIVNSVFAGGNKSNTAYPGVKINKQTAKRYYVKTRTGQTYFSSSKSAWLLYLENKLNHLRRLANKYRKVLHPDVYETLYSMPKEELAQFLISR